MTSREAGQDATLDLSNSVVMAAVSVKEEGIDNSYGNPHQLVGKRATPQRRGTPGQTEIPLAASPSPQNEIPNTQANPLYHIQFMPSYAERSSHPLPNTQDPYSIPAIPNGPGAAEPERLLKGPHIPSVPPPAENVQCTNPLSPSHSGGSHMMNNPEGANVNSGNVKRNHGINKPSANDPLSHRIIEKRRRDRMNNCLADLSRLIPTYYLKKGRGRIEKTEIIEMAIKYMKHLQAHACNQIETCEITTKQEKATKEMEHFQFGYQEAMSETLEFLRDSEGLFSGDSLCVRIMNHLTKHCEKIMKNEGYMHVKLNGSASSSSSSSGYHANGSSNGSSSDGNGSCSNLGSDSKDVLLTEESAYRSDDPVCSDDREMNYAPSGGESQDPASQGVSGVYHPSSGPGSNTSSSGDDNGNRLYKFKSNMKHRFSADAEHSSQAKKKRRDSDSFASYTDSEKDCGRRSFGNPSRQSPYTHYTPSHDERMNSQSVIEKSNPPTPNVVNAKSETECSTVPVFALSSNGAFYVPLSLDQTLLAPFMNNQKDGPTSPTLHPISIYVSFNTPPVGGTLPLTPQLPPLPPVQDTVIPMLDPYEAYGGRSIKEDRRRCPNYPPHALTINHPSPGMTKREIFHNTDNRNLRASGSILPEMQPMVHEGIPNFASHDQRTMIGRHAMREYQNKFQSKGPPLPWSHHLTTSYKD